MKLNDIFKEFFASGTNPNILVIPDNSLGILFQNKIPDLLKTEFDEAQLLDKYVEQFVNAINAAGPGYIPVYKPVVPGFGLGEPEHRIDKEEDKIKTIKTILEWYITKKTIPENEQGKKAFSVLEKVKNEKFGTEGEHLNLQAAYSPVIAKFNIVIANVLKKLQKQLEANPVNKDELEAYKNEVTEYDKVIKAIATVINSQTSDQFSYQWQQLQNIEESKDAITSNVDNVLNLSSDARKVIGVETGEIKDIDTIGKIISMQLRLIGGRMDIITGKKKKGIADEEIKAGLKDKGLELEDDVYSALKEKWQEQGAARKAYATGMLGYIEDFFKLGKDTYGALKDDETEDKGIKRQVIMTVKEKELNEISDAVSEMGATLDYDHLIDTIGEQLMKKTVTSRDKYIAVKTTTPPNDAVVFKKDAKNYIRVTKGIMKSKIVKSLRTYVYDHFKEAFQDDDSPESPPPGLGSHILDKAMDEEADEKFRPVRNLIAVYYSNLAPATSSSIALGVIDLAIDELFETYKKKKAKKVRKSRRGRRESKQRKTIQNLIQLIEQEMNKPKEKTLEQKLVKKLAPLVEQTFKRKQHG